MVASARDCFQRRICISISLVFLFFWNGTYQEWHFTSIKDRSFVVSWKSLKMEFLFLSSYFQLSYLALMWSPEIVSNKQKEYASPQCNDLQPSPKVVLVVLPCMEGEVCSTKKGKAGIRESCLIFQTAVVSTVSFGCNSSRCFFTLTVSTHWIKISTATPDCVLGVGRWLFLLLFFNVRQLICLVDFVFCQVRIDNECTFYAVSWCPPKW